MMDGDSLFTTYVNKLGVSWERLLSSGLSLFIKEQQPERVVFKVHTDDSQDITGYSIQVKTDEESVRKAKEFWEKNVETKLNQ
jgi:hypothetical protein